MNQISRCRPALGTLVEVSIQADCDDNTLLAVSQQALSITEQVTMLMSFHDTDSELSRINREAHHKPIKISNHTLTVLAMAQQLYKDSAGVFDVSIAPCLMQAGYLPNHLENHSNTPNLSNMQLMQEQVFFEQPLTLDLGGIAKGRAVDLAMQRIQLALGDRLQQAVVNAGGDMKVHDWQSYEVLIPDLHKRLIAHRMKKSAVASSSTYYLAGNSAIFDPRDASEVNLSATISVFADSCMVADGLTKVVAVKGVTDPIFKDYQAIGVLT